MQPRARRSLRARASLAANFAEGGVSAKEELTTTNSPNARRRGAPSAASLQNAAEDAGPLSPVSEETPPRVPLFFLGGKEGAAAKTPPSTRRAASVAAKKKRPVPLEFPGSLLKRRLEHPQALSEKSGPSAFPFASSALSPQGLSTDRRSAGRPSAQGGVFSGFLLGEGLRRVDSLRDLAPLQTASKAAELVAFLKPFAPCPERAQERQERLASSASPPCVCVVEGPSGCGKKTLVLTAARSLGMDALEFAEEEVAVAAADAAKEKAGAFDGGRDASNAFSLQIATGQSLLSFLSLVLSRSALPVTPADAAEASSGASPLEKEAASSRRRSFALVHHLPASLLQRSYKLVERMQALLNRALCSGSERVCARRPLVLCVGVDWKEQRLLKRLIPPALLADPRRVCHVRLRAPTENRVEKLLRSVRDSEAAALRRRGNFVLSGALLKADVKAIACAARGDVRFALSALHFSMFNASKPSPAPSPSGRGSSNSRTSVDWPEENAKGPCCCVVSAKDAAWETFHLLGKFLYAKRLVCRAPLCGEKLFVKPKTAAASLSPPFDNSLAVCLVPRRVPKVQICPLRSLPLPRESVDFLKEEDADLLDAADLFLGSFAETTFCEASSAPLLETSAVAERASGRGAFGEEQDLDAWLWAERHVHFRPDGRPLLGAPCCRTHDHEEAPQQLSPSALRCRDARPSLYFSPDAVLAEGAPDPEVFTQLLHANFLPFFRDLQDAALAASAFAAADSVFGCGKVFGNSTAQSLASGDACWGAATREGLSLNAPRWQEAVLCGRAVLDANCHPQKPTRTEEEARPRFGFAFSGSLLSELTAEQRMRASWWRTYSRETRSKVAARLDEALSSETKLSSLNAQSLAVGASLLSGGSQFCLSTSVFAAEVLSAVAAPSLRPRHAAPCCGCLYTPDCRDFLSDWRSLLEARRPRRAASVWGESSRGEAASLPPAAPPSSAVPCERCLQAAGISLERREAVFGEDV